jgi:prepilin-type processing-associated H-X9-DG protein
MYNCGSETPQYVGRPICRACEPNNCREGGPFHYGYNIQLGGQAVQTKTQVMIPLSDAQIARPSETLAVVENNATPVACPGGAAKAGYQNDWSALTGPLDYYFHLMEPRHAGSLNVLFADAHVKATRKATLAPTESGGKLVFPPAWYAF